jgi:Family of unknown function (DUF5677)
MTITGWQVRAARAILRWGVRDLAAKAGISPSTVVAVESERPVAEKSLSAIEEVLFGAGLTLIAENGDGAGVRVKASKRKRREDSLKSQWEELADTLGQTALDILAGTPVTVTRKGFAEPRVLAIMLLSRTLSNFKGVFALIEIGLVVEARVLVRCCFENAFWVAGLCTQGDKFVQKMLGDEMRSRHVRGEMVLSRRTALADHAEKRLREQLRVIKTRWPKAKSLNPKDVALSGVLGHGYVIYSQLSADAAHPTLSSLQRHIGHGEGEGEATIDVAPVPKVEEVAMTLDLACNSMLGVCAGVNEVLGGTAAGQKLGLIADRYRALTTHRKGRDAASPRGTRPEERE